MFNSNTHSGLVLTFFLEASHDLDISEILQLIAHRDGVIRGAELAVYGGLGAQSRWDACETGKTPVNTVHLRPSSTEEAPYEF